MKVTKWYRFVFEDGTYFICGNLSATEIKIRSREHGKLISKTYVGKV